MDSFCRRHFLLWRSSLRLSLSFGDRLRRLLALGFEEGLELAEGAQRRGSLECGLGKLRLRRLAVRLARPGGRRRRLASRRSSLTGRGGCGNRGMLRRRRGDLPWLPRGNLRLPGLGRAPAARWSRWTLRLRLLRLPLRWLALGARLDHRRGNTAALVIHRKHPDLYHIPDRHNIVRSHDIEFCHLVDKHET